MSDWGTDLKAAGVRDKIEAAGASLLYLPPYSPDFNLIEKYASGEGRLVEKHFGVGLLAFVNRQ